jgi:hypothetical protein
VIERRPGGDHSRTSGAKRQGDEEANLRQEVGDLRARDASRVIALSAVGILFADDGSKRVHECVPRQAEIGEPTREIEVTPIEEPVPDFAPIEEPGKSPAVPVREPERVPA